MNRDWIYDLPKKGNHVHSQQGQDGLLDYIFENVGTTNKICVEFGFNADSLTGGSGANTANLILNKGWTGILFDRDFENLSINLHKEALTCENISDVFKKYAIPTVFDYLSIDVVIILIFTSNNLFCVHIPSRNLLFLYVICLRA